MTVRTRRSDLLSTVSPATLMAAPEVPVTVADPWIDRLATEDANRLFTLHSMGKRFDEEDFDDVLDKVFDAAGAVATKLADAGTTLPLRCRYLFSFKEEIGRLLATNQAIEGEGGVDL